MPPSNTSLDEMIAFVAEQSGFPPERLRPETRLAHDLRLSGEKARSLMDVFAERFGVNLGDFQFLDHFNTEQNLMSMFGRASKPFAFLTPITIGHLVDVANQGKWFDLQ